MSVLIGAWHKVVSVSGKALSISFITSVSLIAVRIADGYLSEEKKKIISSTCDSIAIFLDDLKPILWFRSFFAKKGGYSLLLVTAALYLFLSSYDLLFLKTASTDRDLEYYSMAFLVFTTPYIILFYLKNKASQLLTWLLGNGNPFTLMVRLYMVFSLSVVVAVFSYGMVIFVFSLLNARKLQLDKAALLAIVVLLQVVLTYAFALTSMMLISFLFSLTVNALEFILKIFRVAIWKIVGSSKGAFAGLILFLTIALASLQALAKLLGMG